jgi:hypothetical protein
MKCTAAGAITADPDGQLIAHEVIVDTLQGSFELMQTRGSSPGR